MPPSIENPVHVYSYYFVHVESSWTYSVCINTPLRSGTVVFFSHSFCFLLENPVVVYETQSTCMYIPIASPLLFTAFCHSTRRCCHHSLSTLPLLQLILSPSLSLSFVYCNLLPNCFPVSSFLGSVFLDLINNIVCLPFFTVTLSFTEFLSQMTSIKFFFLEFLR